jgi:DNA-directed RNA polymerase specialized sigma24 family protein
MNSAIPTDAFSWTGLEEIPGLCAMPMAWQRQLGTSYDLFRARFLRVNPAIANLPTFAPEAVPLELSWPDLAPRLATALECRPKLWNTGFPHLYEIGEWSEDPVPVLLSLNCDERDFTIGVTGMAARLRQRFILFAATHRHLNTICLETLNGYGAGFFTLNATVRLTPAGALAATRPPAQIFDRFNPPPEPADPTAAKAAFAILSRLDADPRRRKAAPSTVLRLYCVEGLEPEQIADRCRCARSLVYDRLKQLGRTLGCRPAELRQFSSYLEHLGDTLADSRARRIRVEAAIGQEEDPEQAE